MLTTPLAAGTGLEEVVDVEHRLADEFFGALLLEGEQSALDRADRSGGNVAVVRLELLRVVADVLQRRAQVLEVEQQQTIVVGDLEHERQHAFLRLVEVEDAREQQRAHVGDGRPHRVTLLAEDVPEHDGARRECRDVGADLLQALLELRRRDTRPATCRRGLP